jgi:hypothetical protein
MTRLKTTWTGLWVPLVALVALLASGAWLVTQQPDFNDRWADWGNSASGPRTGGGWGMGSGGGDGMMSGSGYGSLPGNGEPVVDLAQARDRASEFAKTLESDLQVGEVMKFSNQYYAEVQEPDGTKATEVLVDADNGAVQLEFGPARMWNTRFGMMSGGDGTRSEVTASQAQGIANEWLADRPDGLTADAAEAFPGYYTLHTLRGDKIEGMLSVNSTSGDVWYHSWHGDFQGMSEVS